MLIYLLHYKIHWQALHQKAETLYIKGNFELALVYYHRGQKLKPDSEVFRLGIQKAQEAIDSAVGGKVHCWAPVIARLLFNGK